MMKTRLSHLLLAVASVYALGTLWNTVGARQPSGPPQPSDPKQRAATPDKKATEKSLKITGEWTGTWGPYLPEGKKPGQPNLKKRLDCKVIAQQNGTWQATFEGECGRPYKYTIQLVGRQVGDVALFKGTVDLGEKDGGVYDWIGRANEQEFVGFYTSQKYTGVFRLTRPK